VALNIKYAVVPFATRTPLLTIFEVVEPEVHAVDGLQEINAVPVKPFEIQLSVTRNEPSLRDKYCC